MKRWTYILAAGAGLFGLFGYLVFAGYAGGNDPKQADRSANVEPAAGVNALGRIEPNGRVIRLTAPSGVQGAIVTRLLVAEGDTVVEGQEVAVLDGYEQQLAVVSEAEARVGVALARLEQIRAGAKAGDLDAKTAATRRLEAELATARAELARAEDRTGKDVTPLPEFATIARLEREIQTARTELGRSQRLFASGDVSRSELDSRQLAVDSLQKEIDRNRAVLQTVIREKRTAVETLSREVERSRSEYTSLAEVRPTDIAAAEAEVAAAEAALSRARADLDAKRVKTYAGGRVLKIYSLPGESIGDDGILDLGDTDTMTAVAEVFEADITRVRVGQRADIVVRTTGETFAGEVIQIDPLIRKRDILDSDPVADVDARVVEVRIRLAREAAPRLSGLTNLRVDVRIAVN